MTQIKFINMQPIKKISIVISAVLLTTTLCFSQDIITNKNSEDIKANVLEVTTTEIKYKKFENPDGPTFSILKSDIVMIRYQNGTKDIFTEEKKTEIVPASSNDDLFTQGKFDANRYYNGYKGAGTTTLLTSLIFSPLIGLIPAIATSSSKPSDMNLNYPNANLMKNTDYYSGYTQKAKKIKQGKVWKNWGIAFGVNLIAAVLIIKGY